MIKYLLSMKCTNTECSTFEQATSFWFERSSTSHPCGICGYTIVFCEVLREQEFPDLELNPPA
jgi:hypothetical protein